MSSNEWIDLALIAARDFRVLLVILFFIGVALFVASMVDIPKFEVKPERQKLAFRYGILIMGVCGLPMVILFFIPNGVDVQGIVQYDDGTRIPNAVVIIGSESKNTTFQGEYEFDNISRNQHLITVGIKNKYTNYLLKLPQLYWKQSQPPIVINRIPVQVSGKVEDENQNPLEGSWVNLSYEKEDFRKTDTFGKFNFGKIEIPFVPSKPLVLSVQMPNESKPRVQLVLEIPSEWPYEIDESPIVLPPRGKIDVTGNVILMNNLIDMTPTKLPYIEVVMGDQRTLTNRDGTYIIHNVPIDNKNYSIKTLNEKELCSRPIIYPLANSPEIPRNRTLIVYKSELPMNY
jgi:hypothetical protein